MARGSYAKTELGQPMLRDSISLRRACINPSLSHNTHRKRAVVFVGRCPEFSPTDRASAFGHASGDERPSKVGARSMTGEKNGNLSYQFQDLALKLANDILPKRSFSLLATRPYQEHRRGQAEVHCNPANRPINEFRKEPALVPFTGHEPSKGSAPCKMA